MSKEPPWGVAADIGGTHARFALARHADGVVELSEQRTLRTADFPTLEAAYETYIAALSARPRRAALAVAGPIVGEDVKLTNSPWMFNRVEIRDRLRLEKFEVVNDFAAIAYALAQIGPDGFLPLTGAAFELPKIGVVSVVGPGSGLGVAMLLREPQRDVVIPTEGGHISYAPIDKIEQKILAFFAGDERVSVERLVCGEGLSRIYRALASFEGLAVAPASPVQLWDAAIAGSDPLAVRARERWLMMLGAFAGDAALIHGARAVVLAGGILPRFLHQIDPAPFMARFCAKGRFATYLRDIPVAILKYAEPGLMGAAMLLK